MGLAGVLGALRREGVLGINRRNSGYTLRWNDRRFYPLVDDKLATKRLCRDAGIPSPALLGVALHHVALAELVRRLGDTSSFVLKPARGAMGNGILVIVDKDGDRYRRPGGGWISRKDLLYHGASIISGLYSLAGHADVAFVEERLEVHPSMAEISYQGVPDVRVIVYRGVPVISMTRLPTREAGGRANLHQGAVGVGVRLRDGVTIHAAVRNRPILTHPDTGARLIGRTIPYFDRLVEIAVRATDQTHLGYVGADVVLDARHGPVILELNARPGLAVQVANRAGLLPRLLAVDAAVRDGMSIEERLALGRDIASRASP